MPVGQGEGPLRQANTPSCQDAPQPSVVLFGKVGDVLVLFVVFSGTSVTPGDSLWSLGGTSPWASGAGPAVPNLPWGAARQPLLVSYVSLLFSFKHRRRVLCGSGEVAAAGDTGRGATRPREARVVQWLCACGVGLGVVGGGCLDYSLFKPSGVSFCHSQSSAAQADSQGYQFFSNGLCSDLPLVGPSSGPAVTARGRLCGEGLRLLR